MGFPRQLQKLRHTKKEKEKGEYMYRNQSAISAISAIYQKIAFINSETCNFHLLRNIKNVYNRGVGANIFTKLVKIIK